MQREHMKNASAANSHSSANGRAGLSGVSYDSRSNNHFVGYGTTHR